MRKTTARAAGVESEPYMTAAGVLVVLFAPANGDYCGLGISHVRRVLTNGIDE
jgi:hypothetical protein